MKNRTQDWNGLGDYLEINNEHSMNNMDTQLD